MANCRYCTFARFEEGRPVACEMVRVLVTGEHNCIAFDREPGSDDDLGERPEAASNRWTH